MVLKEEFAEEGEVTSWENIKFEHVISCFSELAVDGMPEEEAFCWRLIV
jgi:hypothetical protein